MTGIPEHTASTSHPPWPSEAEGMGARRTSNVAPVPWQFPRVRDSARLTPPPSPPWRSSWVRSGSGYWRSGSRGRGRSVRSPTPQTGTPGERGATWNTVLATISSAFYTLWSEFIHLVKLWKGKCNWAAWRGYSFQTSNRRWCVDLT